MGVPVPAASDSVKRAALYTGTITWYIILTVVIAGCGGLIFGYDIGIAGGVVATHAFQAKFFPELLGLQNHHTSPWCKLNTPVLTFFTSSMYLSGAFTSLIAFFPTQVFGRRFTMFIAGLLFLVGATLQATAQNLTMLIFGRLLLGMGVGLANQSVPVYLTEIAPYKWRGAVALMFQQCIVIGILVAQLINVKTSKYSKVPGGVGWRYSLGFAGIPALVLCIGSLCVTDSPSSLAERGRLSQARVALQRIRGCRNVDAEFEDILEAATSSVLLANPWATICLRRYRPQLCLAIIVPLLQQLAGSLSIMTYGPQIFAALGSADDAALLSSVITGGVHVVCTGIMMFTIDWLGRRVAFIQSSCQMITGLAATAIILGVGVDKYGWALPKPFADASLATICIFIAAYSWGWGALAWVYPQEIQPLETRSAGNSITVFTNMMTAFTMQQAFLALLCAIQYGVWLFYAGFCCIGLVLGIWFFPETTHIPSEHMMSIFESHWFWGPICSRVTPEAVTMEMGPSAITVISMVDVKTAQLATSTAQ